MSVKVYSTPTCPFCTMAKSYLKENDISYVDVDVSKDREQAMDMIRKSGQRGVPVIDYNGEIIVGFDKKKLSELIGWYLEIMQKACIDFPAFFIF